MSLTFNWNFNQPINLPHSLTYLIFCYKFNQQINLPSDLRYLTLGRHFHQTINLPNITHLKIKSNNNIIDLLPYSLEELELYSNFYLPINNLPSSLKKICFKNKDYKIKILQNSLEYLKLQHAYNKRIKNFPFNFKIVECSIDYKFINDLSNFNIIFI